ncbi:hypothetical protein BH11BAC1_BH11BAC1_06740 [soil metagenome]
MNPNYGKNRFFFFSFAFLLLIRANFSFAGNGNVKEHFQFPHFFTQSPDNSESYVLRFNKGIMKFADRQIFFQVIQSKSTATNLADPESIMKVPDAISENVTLEFVNANACNPGGSEPLASRTNYFLGNNNNNWKQDLQNYNALQYRNLYKNIDLKYYMLNDEVKYDYTVHPGGDVEDIEMKYSGIEMLTVDKSGALCIQTRLTELKDYLPRSYQVIDGKEIPVKVHYHLTGRYSVGFIAEAYNKNYPLIIDPVLIYSTFVGGSADEYQWVGGIDHDAAGNIYHTGRTFSANFPTTAGAVQTVFGGNYDAYVFKLNSTGTALVYSTFLGGVGMDAGYSVKVEQATGNLWVTGSTDSPTFPVTAGAYQTVNGGTGLTDAFLLKLNAAGNTVIYSTLFGQAYSDYAASMDVDNIGNVYLSGKCNGNVYATAGAFQTSYGGGPWDGFVTKFNSTLSSVLYSTLFGSNQHEVPIAIAVDQNYDIYIAGFEQGGAMPTVPGSYDVTFNGGTWDAFVTKFNSTLSGMLYSTYLGTPGTDMIWNALQVNSSGEAIVAGFAASGFPTTAGAFQTAYGGGAEDVFVAKLNAAGTALVYSTYIGGTGDDEAYGVYLDATGEVYVTGFCGANFPVTSCTYDSTYNGGKDAFVLLLNPTASQLLFSSYFGGGGDDLGYNITVLNNTMYVVGETQSANFPTSAGAYDTGYNGLRDIFAFALQPSVITVTANFNSATHICLNEPIVFNNTSVNATSYYWDFDDGNTSTLLNPVHSFATSGQYDVMLISSAACASPDTMIVQVTIVDLPVASFNSNVPCGLTAGFTDASTGGISYAWDFGDGGTSALTSPSHTYATDGNYVVTLIISSINGCVDTVQQQITISPVAVAAFNFPPPQCNLQVIFQNTSANATNYSWDFGDGSASTNANPSHTYNDTGTYVITLIANPGVCADTVFQSVTLHLPPVASFTELPGCNLQCDFLNTTPGAISYSWNFGDGSTSVATSPSHIYAVDENYTITLIANNSFGCSDTISTQVNINPVAIAAFTFNAPCSLVASFQNTSANSTAVTWYFGDGNSSTTDSPNHTYADTGMYSVMLIVNPNLCPDTIVQLVSIHNAPVASFTSVPQCNFECSFVNNSNGGTIYSWDFGDAQTSAIVSPSHIYSLDGNYTVTLIVQNAFGCVDTIIQQVQINPIPVASFSFPPPLCTMQVSFQNTSQNAASYQWDFGDGFTSSGTNVDHTYSTPGNFLITLITNPGACADTTTQSVTVHEPPVSAFSGISSCDLGYNLVNNSFGGVSYMWDFGDASTSSAVAPSHIYAFSGNYLISLITTDQYGCNDTLQQNVTISDNPVADFTNTSQPCALEVPFQNTSVNASSFVWDFGDGNTSSDFSPVYTYQFGGTYQVTLITNPGACSDTMLQSVTVSQPPNVSFESINNCSFDVQFQNTTDSANVYSWDFGDGTTSSDLAPLHTYNNVGGQDVTLVGTNSSGCADTMTAHIEIVIFAPATFVPAYDTCFRQAQFISTSINSGNYYWDFGDGTSSTDASVVHEYPYPGSFEMLFITNRGTACADTLSETFDAAPAPEHSFYIPNCFTPNGDGLNDRFSVLDFGNCYVYHLTIFSRWGEVIFETDDLNESWDGKCKGKPVPEDVYAYLLKGKDKIKQGSVLVLMK